MRISFFTLLSFLLFFGCSSDSSSADAPSAAEDAPTTMSAPSTPDVPQNSIDMEKICTELSSSSIFAAIPEVSSVKTQPRQGATDVKGFERMRETKTKMAEALGGDTAPKVITDLDGPAFVISGVAGSADYLENGNLWRGYVQNALGENNGELAEAVLRVIVAL